MATIGTIHVHIDEGDQIKVFAESRGGHQWVKIKVGHADVCFMARPGLNVDQLMAALKAVEDARQPEEFAA